MSSQGLAGFLDSGDLWMIKLNWLDTCSRRIKVSTHLSDGKVSVVCYRD